MIHNLAISGGMLYVGTGLSAVSKYGGTEPALIDPRLRVDFRSPDHHGESMGYWPSYAGIEPSCRGSYLRWLAEGRQDPSVGIGYVFLFFYGLERRVLLDHLKNSIDPGELGQIAEEAERLLSIYTKNRSFQSYAGKFLGVVRAVLVARSGVLGAPGASQPQFELPLNIRVAVGSFAKEGKPLPGDWALAWALSDPEFPLRTPAKRCPNEFRELFLHRYAKQQGPGIALQPVCKRLIKYEYHPASASFGGPVQLSLGLPDMATLVRPRRILQSLVEECTSALDGYSRWVRQNKGTTGNLSMAAYLPEEILASRPPRGFAALKQKLDQRVGKELLAVCLAEEVFDHWLADDQRVSRTEAGEAIQLLRKAGFGIEPDPRFGGGKISPGDAIALFRLTSDSPEAASAEYTAASLLLRLALIVASADGEVVPQEAELLRGHLSRALKLTPGEELRLHAQAARLAARPPSFAGLKKQLAALPKERLEGIGSFLIRVAWADGRIHPAEVRALVKMFGLLGLDPASVHSAIHDSRRVGLGSQEPVTVLEGQTGPEFIIPKAEDASRSSEKRDLSLDQEIIEEKLRESAAVSALLASIFTEEERIAEPPAVDTGHGAIRGLDGPHSRLVHQLGTRQAWSRPEFDQLASDLGLLPDGALERINEIAVDVSEGPLVEEDEDLEVNRVVYEALST